MMKQHLSIIPNSMSLLNLLLGFLSIIWAIEGAYTLAAYLILAAVVVDVLDGFVARKISVESRFGLELDSMCDFLSFCVAPSILYHMLFDIPLPLLYLLPVSGALRLSRFNVTTPDKHFSGLPSPAAGGLLASITLIGTLDSASTLLLVTAAVLMVCPLRYKKYKAELIRDGTYTLSFIILIAAIIASLIDSRLSFTPFIAYIILGVKTGGR